jgi:hypothetical protein
VAGNVTSAPPARFPHWVSWSVFIALLLFATLYVTGTASQLPPTVAAHFNAAGLIAFLAATTVWVGVLVFAFRRPMSE